MKMVFKLLIITSCGILIDFAPKDQLVFFTFREIWKKLVRGFGEIIIRSDSRVGYLDSNLSLVDFLSVRLSGHNDLDTFEVTRLTK